MLWARLSFDGRALFLPIDSIMKAVSQCMRKIIKWEKTKTVSVGRNGSIQTTGIDVLTIGQDVVLSPFTSRVDIANCQVSFPADRIVLSELIETLEKIRESLPEPLVQSC